MVKPLIPVNKRRYVLFRLAPWSLAQLSPWGMLSLDGRRSTFVPWEAPWENPVIETIKRFDAAPGKTLDSFDLPLDDPIGLPMMGSYLAAGGL